MNPMQTAKPITMRTKITWGSLRLGRRDPTSIVPRPPAGVQPRHALPLARGRRRGVLRTEERLVAGPSRGHRLVRGREGDADAGGPPAGDRGSEPDRDVRAEPMEAAATNARAAIRPHLRDEGRGSAAAERINEVHERINGVDRVTDDGTTRWTRSSCCGYMRASSRAPSGSNASRSGRLDDAGRQRFHEEQMLAAELVRLPRERIPPTVPELEAYVADTVRSGELFVTDAARSVARSVPRSATGCAMAAGAAGGGRLAFGTLPAEMREGYGLPSEAGGAGDEAGDVRCAPRGSAAAPARSSVSSRRTTVAPASSAVWRSVGERRRARRSLGIRL